MQLEWIVRKLLQRFWRLQRGMTLGVRGIVIDEQGRFLLVRHSYDRGWIFPGGGVEFRETIEESLHRELDEEAGIAANGPTELLGIYSNYEIFPGDHVAIYVIRNWKRLREPKPNIEIAEIGFFAADALPDKVNAGVRRRIAEVHETAPISRYW